MSNSSLKILEMISDYLHDNPDQRFCQSLSNLGILEDSTNNENIGMIFDPYYTDDEVIIDRIKKNIRII